MRLIAFNIFLSGALLLGSVSLGAEKQKAPFTDEYLFELCRHLYRWYLDETSLYSLGDDVRIEFLARRLDDKLDKDDESVYYEMFMPQLEIMMVLKKADYPVPEMDVRIKNRSFVVVSVANVDKSVVDRAKYEALNVSRKDLVEYLFETRAKREYPDKALCERLRIALRDFLGENAPKIKQTQLAYIAPISPVSNDLWVYWQNDRKIILFSSDSDLTDKAYWAYDKVNVKVFDLDEDVVVSLVEKPGSNAYVTRDWASRVLFNCVVLGQEVTVRPRKKVAEEKKGG